MWNNVFELRKIYPPASCGEGESSLSKGKLGKIGRNHTIVREQQKSYWKLK